MICVDSTTQLIKLSPVCDRSISHAGLLWNNVPPECLKFLDPLHTSHSPQPSLSGPLYHFPFNLCQQLLLMVSLSNQILFFTRYLWTGSKCRQAGSLRSRALEFDFSCHDFLKNWTLRNTRLSEPVTDKDM